MEVLFFHFFTRMLRKIKFSKTNIRYSFLTILAFLPMAINAQEYELIWNDEFDYRGKPDKEKWTHETGFIRNLEEQYYTKRKKNAIVKDNVLKIIARKEEYRNRKFDPDIQNYRYNTKKAYYTSASLHTHKKFDLNFGKIEVRAKLPQGKGVWPAIWMLGSNFHDIEWPYSGEIDILEFVGKDPYTIHATVHYPKGKSANIKSEGGQLELETSPTKAFHIYGMNWDSEKIEFSFDNHVYYTFKIDEADTENNPFKKPFFLILNFALGGKWAGEIDDSIFPQEYVIDYVRIYKKAGL